MSMPKRLFQNMKSSCLSCFGWGRNHYLSGIKEDEVGTVLIPRDTITAQNNATLRTTGDGNCMFSTASIWLVGEEALGDVI